MLLYLDNCCFNRPYDDQSHYRINLETQAKLYIQEKILNKQHRLIWSYILQFENDQNPHIAHKHEIAKWKKLAQVLISPSDEIIAKAKSYQVYGLRAKDALHCACAVEANADFFLTTDKQLIKKASAIKTIEVINPLHFIEIEEDL
ncbi:hypothetical protein DOJK_01031 [Patescibacteria group bacterium]|nr:hypothetical protein DOJK_01031 [Patescibacteria group bacterium]